MGLRTFLIIAWMLSHVQSLYPCSMKFKTSRRTTLLMAEHGGMLTLEARNRAFLSGLKLEPEVVTMIVKDERMGNVEVEERVKMLREVTGLTRATLKRYLSKYPSMVIEMFITPVKSSKSVLVRMLGISEAEYVASLHKIGRQTNNKPGNCDNCGRSFSTTPHFTLSTRATSRDDCDTCVTGATLPTISRTCS